MAKQKLSIDTGVQEFEINGSGVLRFNPSDPNVYNRFTEMLEKVQAVENELVAKAGQLPKEDNGVAALSLLAEADRKTKAALQEAFGQENDFDQLLGGVNLMAVAGNGERVVTNLLDALRPIVQEGASRFYEDKANTAVAKAQANRKARRAAGHK